MALQLLRVALFMLGLSAICIALMIMVGGAQWTANTFTILVNLFADVPAQPAGLSDVNTDSELRFFSSLWLAFGALTVHASRSLPERLGLAYGLAAVFFLGGVGRLLSFLSIGAPHMLFMVLMVIELTLPLIILALGLMGRRR